MFDYHQYEGHYTVFPFPISLDEQRTFPLSLTLQRSLSVIAELLVITLIKQEGHL